MDRRRSAQVWLTISVGCASSAVGSLAGTKGCRAGKNSPPRVPFFARALGVRLGVDTERQLERKIGRGEVGVGGHPNSARIWLFSSGLQLTADGFDLRNNDYILDTLIFSHWKG